MDKVSEAKELAKKAHRTQVDKCGEPYINHPFTILAAVKGPNNFEEQIVAVLHDVVEDTTVTLDDLRKRGYSNDVVAAIDAISKRKGETYWAYIDRVKVNDLARKVKLADLTHNSDLERLYKTGDKQFVTIAGRYAKAYFILREWEEAKNGNSSTASGFFKTGEVSSAKELNERDEAVAK